MSVVSERYIELCKLVGFEPPKSYAKYVHIPLASTSLQIKYLTYRFAYCENMERQPMPNVIFSKKAFKEYQNKGFDAKILYRFCNKHSISLIGETSVPLLPYYQKRNKKLSNPLKQCLKDCVTHDPNYCNGCRDEKDCIDLLKQRYGTSSEAEVPLI